MDSRRLFTRELLALLATVATLSGCLSASDGGLYSSLERTRKEIEIDSMLISQLEMLIGKEIPLNAETPEHSHQSLTRSQIQAERERKLAKQPSGKRLYFFSHNGIVLVAGSLPTDEAVLLSQVIAEELPGKRLLHHFVRQSNQTFERNLGVERHLRRKIGEIPNRMGKRLQIVALGPDLFILGMIRQEEREPLLRALGSLSISDRVALLVEVLPTVTPQSQKLPAQAPTKIKEGTKPKI